MPNPEPLMVMVCVCCGRIGVTDVIPGVPLTTLIPVLGGATRFNAGERFGLRLRDAVSVSLVSTEVNLRLLNVADPDESAAKFVPVGDKPSLASVIVTVLVAGANTEPLSVKVTTGAGESAAPMTPLDGGSVVKLRA